jgi:hypothetical protein
MGAVIPIIKPFGDADILRDHDVKTIAISGHKLFGSVCISVIVLTTASFLAECFGCQCSIPHWLDFMTWLQADHDLVSTSWVFTTPSVDCTCTRMPGASNKLLLSVIVMPITLWNAWRILLVGTWSFILITVWQSASQDHQVISWRVLPHARDYAKRSWQKCFVCWSLYFDERGPGSNRQNMPKMKKPSRVRHKQHNLLLIVMVAVSRS